MRQFLYTYTENALFYNHFLEECLILLLCLTTL